MYKVQSALISLLSAFLVMKIVEGSCEQKDFFLQQVLDMKVFKEKYAAEIKEIQGSTSFSYGSLIKRAIRTKFQTHTSEALDKSISESNAQTGSQQQGDPAQAEFEALTNNIKSGVKVDAKISPGDKTDYELADAHFRAFTWDKTKDCFVAIKDEPGQTSLTQKGLNFENLISYMNALKEHRKNKLYSRLIVSACQTNPNILPVGTKILEVQATPEFILKKAFCAKEITNPTFEACLTKAVMLNPKNYQIKSVVCSQVTSLENTAEVNFRVGWAAFGSNDPTSDFDLSVDLTPMRTYGTESMKLNTILEDHLNTIDTINKFVDDATANIMKEWEIGNDKSFRTMEMVLDSNAYPEIVRAYFKLFKDEILAKNNNYVRFLASLDFTIQSTANFLLIHHCMKADKQSGFIPLLPAKSTFCEGILALDSKGGYLESNFQKQVNTMFVASDLLSIYKKEKNRLNFYFYKKMLGQLSAKVLDENDLLGKPLALPELEKQRTEYKKKRAKFTSCFDPAANGSSEELDQKTTSLSSKQKITSENFWQYYTIIPTCHFWAAEAYITYGALIAFKYPGMMHSVRVYAESSIENMSMLIDHIAHAILHAEKGYGPNDYDLNNDATDKFKYLQRAIDSMRSEGMYKSVKFEKEIGTPIEGRIVILPSQLDASQQEIINIVDRFHYYNIDDRLEARKETKKDLFRRIFDMYRFGLDDIRYAKLFAKLHESKKNVWQPEEKTFNTTQTKKRTELIQKINEIEKKLEIGQNPTDPELLDEEVERLAELFKTIKNWQSLLIEMRTNKQIFAELISFSNFVRQAVNNAMQTAYLDKQKESLMKLMTQWSKETFDPTALPVERNEQEINLDREENKSALVKAKPKVIYTKKQFLDDFVARRSKMAVSRMANIKMLI